MNNKILHYEHMPGLEDLVFATDLSADIGMGSWETGKETLLSSGASTCIIIAAHNELTNRGLIGHFVSIANTEGGYSDADSFRQAIDAVKTLGEPNSTSLWLGGGTPNFSQGKDNVEADRLYSQEKARELTKEVKIKWSQAGRVIDVELNCPSGTLVIHDYPERALILGSRTIRPELHPL